MTTPPNATIVHPPHGFVRLTDFAGSDLSVVNAARVSFGKESDWVRTRGYEDTILSLKEDDQKVLEFLMRNRHGTPFEQNYFQFHVRAPIFVFREWHRHRVGISINEESARYVELQPDFYLPDDAHCRKQIGKPGHYEYVPMTPREAARLREQLKHSYDQSFATYRNLIEFGAAKEIARAALPVGIYSQMRWTCNARSLMAFLSLRNAPKALQEIKDYAQAMEDIFLEKMPVTARAFIDGGRVAP